MRPRISIQYLFNRWESVKSLREEHGYLSITEIFAKRKRDFEHRLPTIGNSLIGALARIDS